MVTTPFKTAKALWLTLLINDLHRVNLHFEKQLYRLLHIELIGVTCNLKDNLFIILDEVSENLYLASRNLHKISIVEPQHADPLSLVQFQKVLVSKSAIAKMEELLK